MQASDKSRTMVASALTALMALGGIATSHSARQPTLKNAPASRRLVRMTVERQ